MIRTSSLEVGKRFLLPKRQEQSSHVEEGKDDFLLIAQVKVKVSLSLRNGRQFFSFRKGKIPLFFIIHISEDNFQSRSEKLKNYRRFYPRNYWKKWLHM